MKHDSTDPLEARDFETMLTNDAPPLPPEVEAGMRASLASLRMEIEAASTQTPMNQESWITMAYRSLKSRPLRWAALLAIIVAGLALLQVFKGVDVMDQAYAQAITHLQQARTMICKLQITDGTTSAFPVPLKISYKAPDRWRAEMSEGIVMITNRAENKTIQLNPVQKSYQESLIFNQPAIQGGNTMLDDLQALQSLPANAVSSEFGELDGRRVRIYRLSTDEFPRSLYIDENSGVIVRYELGLPAKGRQVRTIVTDIQLDQPLEDSLFDLTPPADYRPAAGLAAMPTTAPANAALGISASATPAPATESDFTAGLKACAQLFPDAHFDDPIAMANQATETIMRSATPVTNVTPPGIQLAPDAMRQMVAISRCRQFVTEMKPENDFYFTGVGKPWGNAADKIAWWKPTGSTSYRVVHGDLTITDEATAPSTEGPIVVR